jgi:hypothetical protein
MDLFSRCKSRRVNDIWDFARHRGNKCGSKRSQVQGSTFRVKDKKGIKDPKSSIKMLIFPNNSQFGCKFWIRPDEANAFLVNTHPR